MSTPTAPAARADRVACDEPPGDAGISQSCRAPSADASNEPKPRYGWQLSRVMRSAARDASIGRVFACWQNGVQPPHACRIGEPRQSLHLSHLRLPTWSPRAFRREWFRSVPSTLVVKCSMCSIQKYLLPGRPNFVHVAGQLLQMEDLIWPATCFVEQS